MNHQDHAHSLHFTHFSLRYNHTLLYDNFSLTIQKKKWLGILGPSGVGKTTLLEGIAQFIKEKQPLLNLAFLTQKDNLLPWLKVMDNIEIGSLLRNEKNLESKKKAEYLLKKLGIENAKNHYPRQLSGGQAQRVVIARTLYEASDIILMDEPFGHLDAVTKQSVQDLAYHAFQDKTVILVTHDPLEALRLCDEIIVLQGQPVHYECKLNLDSRAPRKMNDKQVLLNYDILMEKLTHAKKKSY